MALQRKDSDDVPEGLPTPPLLSSPPLANNPDLRTPTAGPLPGKPLPMTTATTAGSLNEITSLPSPSWPKSPKFPYTQRPPWLTNDDYPWPPWDTASRTSTWVTSTTTALEDSLKTTHVTNPPLVASTDHGASVSPAPHGYGKGRPDWGEPKDSGGMYAAAAVTPILLLAIIGGLVFFCLRKRKRQRAEVVATQKKVDEMKMRTQPQPVARPFMAPPPTASPPYSTPHSHHLAPPNPSTSQPIILGPIPTGENGAYFTGIDTSDVVSITSANNLRPGPPNPFSDNESLVEPPPPYRPRSAAPPSLSNSSRHSSFRASVARPTTSRTHLIERSPFEDPVDDDAVSVLSGPTRGRNEDEMSAVSDLSYQHDPVVHRSSL